MNSTHELAHKSRGIWREKELTPKDKQRRWWKADSDLLNNV